MQKIVKIEKVKKARRKLRVFTQEHAQDLSVDTIAHFAIYEEKEVSDEQWEEFFEHSLKSEIQEKVINYVTYSPRTESQVRQYLTKHLKKVNIDFEKIAEDTVEKLKEYKYLNDEEYARLFVNSRLKNKPKSRYLLLSELLKKGIEKELANRVLDELLPESFEILKSVYEKKFREEHITFEDKKKISYLQRKGFLWNDISKLINSFEGKNE